MNWPGPTWPRGEGVSLGIDRGLVGRAVAAAADREAVDARDMSRYLEAILATQSHPEVIGPLRDSSGASGLVIHQGLIIGEWGDPAAIEMSFSASKSYLSLVAGVARGHGLIGDLDEPVCARVSDDSFGGDRNERMTWEHLLRQTSEWDGSLWTKPYWADPQGGQSRDTPLSAPGTVWAYNDVRINLLALALTRLWQQSLADVLRTEVLQRIGASNTFEWHGYSNSTIEIDAGTVPVVSGGAHWGGGVWASAYDHARIGYLYLRDGNWDGARILPERWVEATTTSGALNADYGLLWWLNRNRRVFPEAPESGYCARGNLGRQLIWVDPARDLVIVSRWTDQIGLLVGAVSEAIDPE